MTKTEKLELEMQEDSLQAQRWATSYVQASLAICHAEKDLPVSDATMSFLRELATRNDATGRKIRAIQRRLGR